MRIKDYFRSTVDFCKGFRLKDFAVVLRHRNLADTIKNDLERKGELASGYNAVVGQVAAQLRATLNGTAHITPPALPAAPTTAPTATAPVVAATATIPATTGVTLKVELVRMLRAGASDEDIINVLVKPTNNPATNREPGHAELVGIALESKDSAIILRIYNLLDGAAQRMATMASDHNTFVAQYNAAFAQLVGFTNTLQDLPDAVAPYKGALVALCAEHAPTKLPGFASFQDALLAARDQVVQHPDADIRAQFADKILTADVLQNPAQFANAVRTLAPDGALPAKAVLAIKNSMDSAGTGAVIGRLLPEGATHDIAAATALLHIALEITPTTGKELLLNKIIQRATPIILNSNFENPLLSVLQTYHPERALALLQQIANGEADANLGVTEDLRKKAIHEICGTIYVHGHDPVGHLAYDTLEAILSTSKTAHKAAFGDARKAIGKLVTYIENGINMLLDEESLVTLHKERQARAAVAAVPAPVAPVTPPPLPGATSGGDAA